MSRDLTAQERQVLTLRESTDPPMSFSVIAKQMNRDQHNLRAVYKRAREKLDYPDRPFAAKDGEGYSTEHRHPEKAAAFIDALTEPGSRNVAAAAAEAGLGQMAGHLLAHRMEEKYPAVEREVKRIKTETLVRKFEMAADMALDSITQEKLDELDAYKLTLVAAIATDKRELLDGRPTERISIEDRRLLPELMTRLLEEAQRRGLMPDRDVETLEVRMVEDPRAPSRPVRNFTDGWKPYDGELALPEPR